MPVVLIPIHFDRDPHQRPFTPSCQRSVVIRTFISSDFMTGVPATPGKHLAVEVIAWGGGGGGNPPSGNNCCRVELGTTWWGRVDLVRGGADLIAVQSIYVEQLFPGGTPGIYRHWFLPLLQVLSEMQQSVVGVPGISRVLYDLTPKPPGTTEWE